MRESEVVGRELGALRVFYWESVQVLNPLFNSRMMRAEGLSMHEEQEVVIYVTTEKMHALEG